MSLRDIPIETIDGEKTTLAAYGPGPLLVVNVASKCGNTPQYAGLQRLQETYGPRGLTVVGFPCNQFLSQEPGTPEEIKEFCRTNYGVTFPLMAKIKVKGAGQHPLYAELTKTPDSEGTAGSVKWNFEKFLIRPDGSVVRFRPKVQPEDPAVVGAIEDALALVG